VCGRERGRTTEKERERERQKEKERERDEEREREREGKKEKIIFPFFPSSRGYLKMIKMDGRRRDVVF